MMTASAIRSPSLRWLVLAVSSCAAIGCSSNSAGPPASSDGGASGADSSSTVPLTPSEARLACAFDAGSLASATQDPTAPNAATIPINNVVVIMMENRSFDHYFQDLNNEGWTGVDVAPASATNPGIDGGPVPFVHADYDDGGAPGVYCFADTNHSWDGTHTEIADGGMSGFAVANDGTHEDPMLGPPGFLSGSRAMVYYDTQADLPFMYWAASNFAIGDHYFASVPGPTWPNREYLYAATSWGETTTGTFPKPTSPTVLDSLNAKGVSWEAYAASDGFATALLFIHSPTFGSYTSHVASSFDQFTSAAQAGTLPSVSFVDPGTENESYQGLDEHPPAVMQVGEAWLSSVLASLVASPQWPNMAVFLLFDEHGGLYDHEVPPSACKPDSTGPIPSMPDGGTYGGFDEYGVRLPFVVISPYAKPHYVGHLVYDHTSVLRFIEARFGLPALTKRDANALVPWDVFDFTTTTPNLTPPAPPTVPVNSALIQQCQTIFTAQGVSTSGYQD
jgi:phospholipase C